MLNLAIVDFGISFGISLFMAAASLVLSELLKPKPKIENARPAALGDFKFPTAEEGRPIPIVFGTIKQEGPNVVWYGDFRQSAIKQTLKTGLWSKKSFVKGYRYYFGVQLGLGLGQLDAVKRIWIGDTEVWSGTVQDGTVSINLPSLFGGDDFGNGGMVGTFRIHSGSTTQAVNSYLGAFQSPLPAYRGTAYAVWEGGYIGNGTSIKPWKFELQRFPNGLAMTGGKHIVNSYDANPMCVLYELLTSPRWGYGFPDADINLVALRAAGDVLYAEGNGFSTLIDTSIGTGEFLDEIERQIAGVVYLDQATGKWTVSLARGGYSIGAIPQIVRADGDVVRIEDWNPGCWEGLVNEIRVEFSDRARDYKRTYAQGSNSASIRLQNRVEPKVVKYPGVKDATLANNIAAREIRALSRPLSKATLVVPREFWELNPGDVIAWTDDVIGHNQLAMRVTRVDLGTLAKGEIKLGLVQDVFAFESAFNGAPPTSGWVAPTQDVEEIPAARHVVFEAPYGILRRDEAPDTLDRLWAGGRKEDAPAVGLRLYQRNAVGAPSGAYALAGEASEFLLIGKLKVAVGEDGENPSSTDLQLEADDDTQADLLAAFVNGSAGDVGQNLANLVLVDDELMGVTTVTDQTTYVELETVYRGMLDTVPADHAIGAKVYLLFVGGNLSDTTIPRGNNVHAQLRQASRTDETTLAEAVVKSLTMADRARCPYPPVELEINGARYPAAPTWDTLKSGGTTLDERGWEVGFLRRDWRTFDEVAGLETDAATLDASFPTRDSTQYRAEAIDDPLGAATSLVVTTWNGGDPTVFVSRTKVLRATAGLKPSTARLEVQTKHELIGDTFQALQVLGHTFAPGTSTLDDDENWGNLPYSTISGTWTAPVSGTYTFNLGTAMPSGAVEARINGGGWGTVVAAGATTGTLVGVTATDTIEIRHVSNTGTATETFLESLAPSGTVNAYAILVY